MFSAENDRALGIPVVNHAYPEGEEGIQLSLATICKKIREGMSTAVMKSYAGNVLKQAGFPDGVRAQAAALLAHVRQAVMYAPDALGTEQIQSAMVTLCVDGAPVCIPIADCDDLVVALGTLCAAVGMDVEVIRQFFGDGIQQHVLVQVLTEEGMWFPLDPSSKTMPPGQKARATKETTCSPWDTSITGLSNNAEFVGIGSLPVMMPGWKRVPSFMSLEDYMMNSGLGSIWAGAAFLQPQADWLSKFWDAIDPLQRTWQAALASASQRAQSGNWIAGDAASKGDLMALLVWSSFQSRAMQEFPEVGPVVSDVLLRTWVVMLRQIGIDPAQFKASDLRSRMVKDGYSQANLALFDLLAILIGGVVAFATVAAALYFITYLVDNVLARNLADDELIRLHNEQNQIVEKHLADGSPYTEDEKKRLQDLKDQQDKIMAQNAPSTLPVTGPSPDKKSGDDNTWMWVAIFGLGAATVLGVVYRDQIKKALDEL